MKKLFLTAILSIASVSTAFAEDVCTKDQAKEAVEKVCKEIEAKGDGALEMVQTFRFCGSNYVWVQDSDLKMVIHPIKPKLNGSSLKENKDDNGKLLFVEFDKSAKANKNGGWVDYVWPNQVRKKRQTKFLSLKNAAALKAGSLVLGSGNNY